MSHAPSVSVITPTRNRLELLQQTMDSVKQQTLENWEHIVVDDGSDDGTAEVVEARARADRRVRYIRRTGNTRGANVCRNMGFRDACADLIVLLDSDDLLEPDCLARRVELMNRNQDLDFAVSRTGVFVSTPGDLNRELDAEMMGDDLLRFLYFEVPWQTTAPIWRRAALERIGGFDETLPSWQDVDLHVRALAAGLRYFRLPYVDHHMRWQEDTAKVSFQQRRSSAHLEAALPLFRKFERVVAEGPGLNWVRQRALCSLYFFAAERWVDMGNLHAALDLWKTIRQRSLGSRVLHRSGAVLLWAESFTGPVGAFARRLTHKWKGWMRLRTNPELVALRR